MKTKYIILICCVAFGGPARAADTALNAETYQQLLDGIAARVTRGLRRELRGPCPEPEVLLERLTRWTPMGSSGLAAAAAELQARGLSPEAVSAWVSTHPEEAAAATMNLDGLGETLARHQRRCGRPTLDEAALSTAYPFGSAPIHAVEPPPPTPPGPAWESALEPALTRATAEGRPVLVWFGADWAMAVRIMEREAWSDPAVLQLIDACFVPLRLDVTAQDAAQTALLARWDVLGLPTTLLVDADGSATDRRVTASLSADALRETLAGWCPSPPR